MYATYRQLRVSRALMIIKDVPLRTRRVHCIAIPPLWLSTEHLLTVITPFWFSADEWSGFSIPYQWRKSVLRSVGGGGGGGMIAIWRWDFSREHAHTYRDTLHHTHTRALARTHWHTHTHTHTHTLTRARARAHTLFLGHSKQCSNEPNLSEQNRWL